MLLLDKILVMTVYVKEAGYLSDYRIHFTFSDGVEREIDFESFLTASSHPEIRKYLDISKFRDFKIVHGNLDWNNFELCFPVADLYDGNIHKEPEAA